MTTAEAKILIATPNLPTQALQQWADLGCGNGLFTKALLSLLPNESILYAIDNHPYTFSDERIHFLHLDFEKDNLPLPSLNGMMMANSLHFVKDKLLLLQKLKKHLKPDAAFLLVEYDTQTGNRWVPYPLSFSSAATLFTQAGFNSIEKINERRSLYHHFKIYAAFITK